MISLREFRRMDRQERTRIIDRVADPLARTVLRAAFGGSGRRSWTQVARKIGGGNTPDAVRMIATRALRKAVRFEQPKGGIMDPRGGEDMSYQYANERERTALAVNFNILQGVELTPMGNPIVQPADLPADAPAAMIGFNEARTCAHPERFGVHFFLDDYQFERVWRNPRKYVNLLRAFPFVLGPDFSLYTDYPEPLQRWNHYRNQLLTAWFQAEGVRMIPTAGWAGDESLSWCFDGMPDGGTVAVSTVGCLVHKTATAAFLQGFWAMLQETKPDRVLVYGKSTPEIEAMAASTGASIIRYAHGQAIRTGREKGA